MLKHLNFSWRPPSKLELESSYNSLLNARGAIKKCMQSVFGNRRDLNFQDIFLPSEITVDEILRRGGVGEGKRVMNETLSFFCR